MKQSPQRAICTWRYTAPALIRCAVGWSLRSSILFRAVEALPARRLRVPRVAAALLVAFAAPVALPLQAQAQTEVWSGTLTVKELNSDTVGCSNGAPGNLCSVHLSDDDFTHDSTDFAIVAVQVVAEDSQRKLFIYFDPDLTTAQQGLTLNVDGAAFAFADADVNDPTYKRWDDSGLSWTAGNTVSLTLTEADTTAPSPALAAVASDGIVVAVVFDEALAEPAPTLSASAFTLTADGVELDIQNMSFGCGHAASQPGVRDHNLRGPDRQAQLRQDRGRRRRAGGRRWERGRQLHRFHG